MPASPKFVPAPREVLEPLLRTWLEVVGSRFVSGARLLKIAGEASTVRHFDLMQGLSSLCGGSLNTRTLGHALRANAGIEYSGLILHRRSRLDGNRVRLYAVLPPELAEAREAELRPGGPTRLRKRPKRTPRPIPPGQKKRGRKPKPREVIPQPVLIGTPRGNTRLELAAALADRCGGLIAKRGDRYEVHVAARGGREAMERAAGLLRQSHPGISWHVGSTRGSEPVMQQQTAPQEPVATIPIYDTSRPGSPWYPDPRRPGRRTWNPLDT